MSVEGNAPIVTLQFKRQNGTIRAARFVFDSGGGAVLFDSALVSDLGLKPSGAEIGEAGERYVPVNPPEASIGFRVEIDYPHVTTYLEQVHQPDADNMNSAGLVLDSDAANQLVVVSVSATADEITRRNVLPGDIILQIEGKSETPWTITAASQALSGAVGETIAY